MPTRRSLQTWSTALTERPACFEIVPMALAVRQAPARRHSRVIVVATRSLQTISRPMSATAPGVRELHSTSAEYRLGAISSSRCQTTRALYTRQRHAKPSFTSGRAAVKRHLTHRGRRHAYILKKQLALSGKPAGSQTQTHQSGGARRDRTDDLLLAKQALSQLSYGPVRKRNTSAS